MQHMFFVICHCAIVVANIMLDINLSVGIEAKTQVSWQH